MLKKIAVAATFAASTLIGVPAASAGSPGACMSKYMDDLIECGGVTSCEMWADVVYIQCIQGLHDGIDPEPNT